MSTDKIAIIAAAAAALGMPVAEVERVGVIGVYEAVCHDADGNELWRDKVYNLVTTQGKNEILNQALAGSAFTAAWYMGLISSVSYTAIAAADTAASHTGWLEAGGTNAPTYTGPRKTTAWSAAAAGAKALSAGLVFTFTGSGTVKGAFIQSASALDSTTGVLLSAGLFSGGDQPVVATNTLTVTYTLTLT